MAQNNIDGELGSQVLGQQLAAPAQSTAQRPKLHPKYIVAIAVAIVIILAGAVVFYGIPSKTAATTTTPQAPQAPQIPPALMQRPNVLFEVPTAPMLYNYYNSSSSNFYFVQYALNFMQPLFANSTIVPPNTIIPVPQQYANTTSPVIVSFYIGSTPSYAAAVSNYTAGIAALRATFPQAATSSITVGNMSSLFSYQSYGLNTYALFFVDNNYYVILNIFGTSNLNMSYITDIAAHINSLIPSGTSG